MSDERDQVPESIGPYRVVRGLAQGGMAAVFEVEDDRTGQRLALKLLTQRGLAMPRFKREYRALSRLDHPNIVRVFRYGASDDGRPFLVMELVDGVAAQVYAKSCGRPGTPRRTEHVLRIAGGVANALGYLHARGIVHRDLKSANILVLKDGRPKLLDFGTARLQGGDSEITRHGEFVGTFAYASPEQLTGSAIDTRSDVYSMGVLFYRLLTGKRPFEADNPHALARLHLEHIPTPPDALVAGVSPELSALVMGMLSKSPDERPSNGAEVAAVLAELGGGPTTREEHVNFGPVELVGRDAEVAALRAVLDRCRPGRLVIVTGHPGAGRRRLLEQAGEDARALRWRVVRGEFNGGPGLGAVARLARKLARGLPPAGGDSGDPLADLALAGRVGALGDHDRGRLLDAVTALICRRADLDNAPVMLQLVALHRAPPLALEALERVRAAVQTAGHRVVFMASSTEEADLPGTSLRARFPEATRLALRPLDTAEVGRLIGVVLGRTSAPASLARRVHAATGGMPGYIVEVVHSMVRQGLVEAGRGSDDRVSWLDRSGGRVAIPGSMRELLGMRIDALGAPALRVLEALSLAGGAASADTLRHAVELSEPDVQLALQRLLDERLVHAPDDWGRWVVRIGLTAQLVRERIRASRRLVLQRRLAEALVDAPPTASKIRLLIAAGDLSRATVDALHWSAPRLRDFQAGEALPILDLLFGRIEAAEDARSALPDAQMAGLCLLRGRARALVDARDPRALSSLEQASALADGDLSLEVDLELAILYRRRGEGGRAQGLLDRARRALEGHENSGLRVRAAIELGVSRALMGQAEQALAAYQAAVQAARRGGDTRAEAEGQVGAGISQYSLGLLGDAEASLERAVRLYADVGVEQGRWHAAMNLSELYRVQGRLSEALGSIEPDLDRARFAGRPFRYAGMLLNLADTLIELYRLGEVRQLIAELERIDLTRTHPYLAAALASVRGRLALAAGEPAEAVRVLRPAVGVADDSGLKVVAHMLRARLGEALAGVGEREGAERVTRQAVTGLQWSRHMPELAEACASRARALGPEVDPAEVYRPVAVWIEDQPVRLVRVAHALAHADRAEHLGQRGAALAWLEAADTALSAVRDLLTDTDRSSLRVHPWRDRIRRGRDRLGADSGE